MASKLILADFDFQGVAKIKNLPPPTSDEDPVRLSDVATNYSADKGTPDHIYFNDFLGSALPAEFSVGINTNHNTIVEKSLLCIKDDSGMGGSISGQVKAQSLAAGNTIIGKFGQICMDPMNGPYPLIGLLVQTDAFLSDNERLICVSYSAPNAQGYMRAYNGSGFSQEVDGSVKWGAEHANSKFYVKAVAGFGASQFYISFDALNWVSIGSTSYNITHIGIGISDGDGTTMSYGFCDWIGVWASDPGIIGS